jgi:hypothetical protein
VNANMMAIAKALCQRLVENCPTVMVSTPL